MHRKMPDRLLSGSELPAPAHPSSLSTTSRSLMAWRSDLPAHTEQIRPCPVHPGKSAFLPVKELSL